MKKAQMAIYVMILCVGLSPSLDSAVDKKTLTKLQALGIVRALNTAELDAFLQHKNYAPLVPATQRFRGKTEGLDELVTNSMDAPSGRIRDYEVSIIISSDGKHYKIALTPVAESPVCTTAFFSDESGVIYAGTILDCGQ